MVNSPAVLKPARVNLAILTYNALNFTKMCLESLARNTKIEHNVFILDNGSTDGSREWLAQHQQQNLYYEPSSKNLGVPGGRNRLIELIRPSLPEDGFIVFSDNDMEFLPGWDEVYLSFFRDHPEAGIASAFGHRMVVHNHFRELLPAPKCTAPVDVACGGFVCWVSKPAIDAIQGFDEKLGLFWHEDDDFSVRCIAAGYDVYALPHIPVVHHEHKSGAANPGIKKGGSPENQRYLCEKWRALGVVDSYGRIVRKSPPQPLTRFGRDSRPIDLGGYSWLGPAVTLASANEGGFSECSLALSLSCAKREFYDTFPFAAEVLLDGAPWMRLNFSESDETHELSLPLKPQSRIQITTTANFIPALCGLGFSSVEPVALRVSGLPDAVSILTPLKGDEAPAVTWISSLFDTDEYAHLTHEVVPALATQCPSLSFLPLSLDENALESMKSDPEWLARWKSILRVRGVSGSCVVACDPLTPDGQNRYQLLRSEHPHIEHLAGLVLLPSSSLSKEWIAAALVADELWVLSEEERRVLVQHGFPEHRVARAPFCADPAIFKARQAETLAMVGGRMYFIAEVTSPDDPFFRTCTAAYLHAFSKDDPTCLFVTLSPTGAVLPADLLQSLVADPSLRVEERAPVCTIDPLVSPRTLATYYQSALGFICPPSGRSRFARSEAEACGCPVLVVDPVSCVVSALHEGPKASVLSEQGRTVSLDDCLKPELVQSLSTALREKFVNAHESLAAARARCVPASRSIADWIAEQIRSPKQQLQQNIPIAKVAGTPTIIREVDEREAITIGVDARTLTYPETMERGIGHYTLNHLREVITQRPEWQFVLYRDEGKDTEPLLKLKEFPNVRFGITGEQRSDDLSLYHIADPMTILPGFDSPFLIAPPIPQSAVFYDLIPIVKHEMHFDRWEPWRKSSYERRLAELKRSGTYILAISECTRQDLFRMTGYPLERSVAIMAGINRAQGQPPTAAAIDEVLRKYGIRTPFFMSVGGLDGHKGFNATANAYANLAQNTQMNFAIVGSFNDPYKDSYRAAFETNRIPGVVFTGYLSREEMSCLYAASHGLVFPSHYEGFGFPVLEAMAHGCPVITTKVSSLPEVAGDAGILVPVDDAGAIATAMKKLLSEPGLREELIRRGREQAQKFSWEQAARKTITVWEGMLRHEVTRTTGTEPGLQLV